MQQEDAQLIGVNALGWIASQETVFEAFLMNTGARPEDLRALAGEDGFLTQVLDFVMLQDEWVIEFASASSMAPERVVMARAVLGHGDTRHWT
ncbi:DUF3572 domain-containing protein [Albirhodobacter sp. R86504]|jgi:hypothetical protein|uniref:DUF3572 domain-containing protein n=1 Tax=Albirhodobacter sp. R86504 TaxID=3093848 RepID=UPI00366C14F8